jgi:leukotriene-A4 hydrolase
MASKRDPNTLSNYHEIRTTEISIDFDINFEKKRLEGGVSLKLKGVAKSAVKEVILDTRLVSSVQQPQISLTI